MDDCIFCKIIKHEIPAQIIYEDDEIMAFNDIHPQAPVHILLLPKKHIQSVAALSDQDTILAGKLILKARDLAEKLNLKSFRLVANSGEDAGQSVPHLHFHLLGGRKLGPIV